MRKARASLITSIMIGLFAVTTAGVSTYAWFQANASATITATGDTTTITVSDPNEDYTVQIYKYNDGECYYPSSTSSATWSSFTLHDAATIPTKSIWPGKSVTFCLKTSAVEQMHKLMINAMASSGFIDTTHRRFIYKNSSTTTTDIDIRWAMQIYGYGVALATNATPSNSVIRTFLAKNATDNSAETKYSCSPAGVETINDLASATPSGSQNIYLFFTIHFSNVSSTWYKSVTNGGAYIRTSPTFSGTTYWQPYSEKNALTETDAMFTSNVYQGLRFKIDELAIL